jgi:pimeloyl-ACP methyl ester carboxylesterase
VFGYSDGGNIALWLARKAPDIFTKVVAISPNCLVRGLTGGTLRLIRTIAKILHLLERMGLPVRPARMRFDLMTDDIGLTADDLARIATDLSILYAERDVVRQEHIEAMERLIPGATVHRIAQCNHLTIPSKQETIEDILSFLLGR